MKKPDIGQPAAADSLRACAAAAIGGARRPATIPAGGTLVRGIPVCGHERLDPPMQSLRRGSV